MPQRTMVFLSSPGFTTTSTSDRCSSSTNGSFKSNTGTSPVYSLISNGISSSTSSYCSEWNGSYKPYVMFSSMGLRLRMCFWVGFFLFFEFPRAILSEQDGFLSLSCGGVEGYVDALNIEWTPDSNYITTGSTAAVNYIDGTSSSGLPVRFFSNTGGRNCYHLPLPKPTSVLVRARFVYKNYDNLRRPPAFFVSLGTAMASHVNLNKSDPWTEEFVWAATKRNDIPLCFHSIPNAGYPVVSSIEVRPLPKGAYRSNKLLRKSYRINCGFTNASLRYPVDPYDRIWDSDIDFSPSKTSSAAFSTHLNSNALSASELPPADILQTARVSLRKSTLTYNLELDKIGDYYIVLYFAGLLRRSSSFNVLINGDLVQSNYTVENSGVNVLYLTQHTTNKLNITFQNVSSYTQVNAIEVYEIIDVPQETSSTTVSALQVIQQYTGLDLGWQDDPCSPKPWNHLLCEGSLVRSLELSDMNLRSISPTFSDLLDLKNLDLHNTSLEGELENLGSLLHLEKLNLSFNNLTSFGNDLDNLINLQVLDLQNNSLEGAVPRSLGALKDLHLLNLENNKLQGPLPQSLNKESLVVRGSGNVCLNFSTSLCGRMPFHGPIEEPQVTIINNRKNSGNKHIALILAATAGVLFLVAFTFMLVFLYTMIKTNEDPYATSRTFLDMRNWNSSARVFSYKEIKAATNNFKEVIGRGSFGPVYLGKLSDGKMVAVKVRFDRTQLGADSFINEVCLLSKFRHQNLVFLEGFCQESKQQILIYEYLPGGSLADNLYGTNSKKFTLSWVRRLKIAVDAAKGLDYLHNGSEPRIIHRDVKCSNILLDSQMNAKVCDFGLCKQLTRADATHVTTVVKGTAGYLDPEYYTTQQLTEKSDIYSFGVVLLELICGREPLTHSGAPDTFNLVLWAKPFLQAGAFEIVDESIKGAFDMESMKKAACLASRCVERDASIRPTISEVLDELRQAYTIQLAYLATTGHPN